jgi:hypothetical protein
VVHESDHKVALVELGVSIPGPADAVDLGRDQIGPRASSVDAAVDRRSHLPQITWDENGAKALLSLRSLMRGILDELQISTGPLAALGPILAGIATADTAGMLLNLGQCRIKRGMRTLFNPSHCHERVTLRVDGERLRSGLPDIPH